MVKIGAVVLNYNCSHETERCISFLKHQIKIKLEIIVVDNNSLSDDLEKVRNICKSEDILLLVNEENKGYAAGNNVGLKYADLLGCDFVLIINPDVELRDGEYLSKAVLKMKEDATIAALGSDIVNAVGQHQNPMRELKCIEELLWPLELLINKLRGKLPYTLDHTQSRYCHKLSGCCILIRLDFLKEIGFLDENTFLYCEEPIFAKQVQNSGRKMFYSAEITAWHMHFSAAKGDPLKRLNLFYQSRRYYLNKYSGYLGLKLRVVLFSRKIQNKFYNIRYRRSIHL